MKQFRDFGWFVKTCKKEYFINKYKEPIIIQEALMKWCQPTMWIQYDTISFHKCTFYNGIMRQATPDFVQKDSQKRRCNKGNAQSVILEMHFFAAKCAKLTYNT